MGTIQLVLVLIVANVLILNGEAGNVDSFVNEVSGLPVCLINDNCFKTSTNLDNYCCVILCCNMFQYIGRNKNTFGNIMDTINNPRPVNIFLFVIPICVLATIFILVLLICCCECLKEKRIVYQSIKLQEQRSHSTC